MSQSILKDSLHLQMTGSSESRFSIARIAQCQGVPEMPSKIYNHEV